MHIWSARGLKIRNRIRNFISIATKALSDHYNMNYNSNTASKAKSNLCYRAFNIGVHQLAGSVFVRGWFNYDYNSDPRSPAVSNIKRARIKLYQIKLKQYSNNLIGSFGYPINASVMRRKWKAHRIDVGIQLSHDVILECMVLEPVLDL